MIKSVTENDCNLCPPSSVHLKVSVKLPFASTFSVKKKKKGFLLHNSLAVSVSPLTDNQIYKGLLSRKFVVESNMQKFDCSVFGLLQTYPKIFSWIRPIFLEIKFLSLIIQTSLPYSLDVT